MLLLIIPWTSSLKLASPPQHYVGSRPSGSEGAGWDRRGTTVFTAQEQPVFSTGSRTGRWALDLRLLLLREAVLG